MLIVLWFCSGNNTLCNIFNALLPSYAFGADEFVKQFHFLLISYGMFSTIMGLFLTSETSFMWWIIVLFEISVSFCSVDINFWIRRLFEITVTPGRWGRPRRSSHKSRRRGGTTLPILKFLLTTIYPTVLQCDITLLRFCTHGKGELKKVRLY